MLKYSNQGDIPLSLAVFLASDWYDHDDDPNTISVTSLIKPIRQTILAARVPAESAVVDISNLLQSRMGTAIHDGVEKAWVKNYANALRALGYPERVIQKVKVNPTSEEVTDDIIPVYIERRTKKQVGNWKVSGKFDLVFDGRVEDMKTTSVFTAMNNTSDEKYILQGSMYRWLNPDIITKDEIAIQWLFTDWNKVRANSDPKYPQRRHMQKIFPLMPIAATQAFVERKLNQLEAYWDAPEDEIPQCSDADLWRSEPVFKYYKNPEKTTRSTKNFDTHQEAMLRYIEDGSVGLIKEVPGQATACKYCPAFPVCTQKDQLIAQGDLIL